MKRNALILCLAAAFSSTMIACKKDTSSDGASTTVDGTWDFVSLEANTRVTVSAQGESQISTSHYASTKASGSVTMLNGKYSSDGMPYTASGTVSNDDPLDPENSITVPLDFDMPGIKSSGTYKVIGDSLYTSGAFATPNDATNSGAPTTTGGKFRISNDTLILTSTVAVTQTVVQNGITGKVNDWGVMVTKLVRKK